MTNKQLPNGFIIKSNAGLYDVYLPETDNTLSVKSRGVLRHKNKQPIVGDAVWVEKWEETWIMTEIFERKNELIRPLIANIDTSIIVISAKEPDFQQYLLDKYLALLTFNHIEPIIIFSKYDLLSAAEYQAMQDIRTYYEQLGYPCFHVHDKQLQNTNDLEVLLAGKIATVMGQTGVGKTTLLNSLSKNRWQLQTNEISTALGRGKHTTRIVELFRIKNYWIADTPGFSSFNVFDIHSTTLTTTFVEFAQYPCQFNNCVHINEKKCGVKTAVENGEILSTRYQDYCKIYDEIKKQEEHKKW